MDKKDFIENIPNPFLNARIEWVHCDRKFDGYYATDYSVQNWQSLIGALKSSNKVSPFLFSISRYFAYILRCGLI